MQVQAYLSFDGRCEEALAFYRETLGAEVTHLMRYKDMPEPPPGMVTPETENKVLHSAFRIGDTELMAADGGCGGAGSFQGITLTLSTPSDAETARLFDALAQGGSVQMPLAKTFFASSFGTLTDRFGVMWMLITDSHREVMPPHASAEAP